MDFKTNYPDFAAVEDHIRHARAERAVAIASWLSATIVTVGRGLRQALESTFNGFVAERDRRAIEADAFLKRSVPKY